MKRVAVLGPGGAGKTRLSHELARRTGLPLIHLDPIFYRGGWQLAPRDDAVRALNDAVARDEWIIDGNFLGADDHRFERADLVVLLDLPRLTCIRRTLWRRVRDRGRMRPDHPELEKFDWRLIKWIWNWHREDLSRALERMATVSPETRVHRLRSRADVERSLREEC